jgi:hypothetical protein
VALKREKPRLNLKKGFVNATSLVKYKRPQPAKNSYSNKIYNLLSKGCRNEELASVVSQGFRNRIEEHLGTDFKNVV